MSAPTLSPSPPRLLDQLRDALSRKAAANARNHGVEFAEAQTVFGDPLESTILDPDHSVGEHRFLSMGRSDAGRVLIVSYTERGGRVRVISARPATARERKAYEAIDPAI